MKLPDYPKALNWKSLAIQRVEPKYYTDYTRYRSIGLRWKFIPTMKRQLEHKGISTRHSKRSALMRRLLSQKRETTAGPFDVKQPQGYRWLSLRECCRI